MKTLEVNVGPGGHGCGLYNFNNNVTLETSEVHNCQILLMKVDNIE